MSNRNHFILFLVVLTVLVLLLIVGLRVGTAQAEDHYCYENSEITEIFWVDQEDPMITRSITSDEGIKFFRSWDKGIDAWYQDESGSHLVGLTQEEMQEGKWFELHIMVDTDLEHPCYALIWLPDAKPALMYPAYWSAQRIQEDGELSWHPDIGWFVNNIELLDELETYSVISRQRIEADFCEKPENLVLWHCTHPQDYFTEDGVHVLVPAALRDD